MKFHGLEMLQGEVKIFPNEVNAGLLYTIRDISENQMEALCKAMSKVSKQKECSICIDTYLNSEYDLSIRDIQKKFPDQNLAIHLDKRKFPNVNQNFPTNLDDDFQKTIWIGKSVCNAVAGLEFECMIYIFPKCNVCLKEEYSEIVASRAKSCLVVAKYYHICEKCEESESMMSKRFSDK